jgi:hypothetical protein
LRCLVLGLILGTFAISIAPAMSSKTLQCILGVCEHTGTQAKIWRPRKDG